MKQWESAVKRLIEKVAMRRASERSSSRLTHFSTHSGYPSSHPRNGAHDHGYSTHPAHVSSHPHPYTNGHRPYRQSSPYGDHAVGNGITSHATGPPGYPPHDGFDPDDALQLPVLRSLPNLQQFQTCVNSAFQTNLADGWILDPSNSSMTWTAISALSQVGARRDHFVFNAGGQIVFGFGA